jgi:hypothetical protein
MIRVLIAGEGVDELGPLPPTAFEEGERASGGGVIEALITKVRPTGWRVIEAMVWKDVRKLKANAPGHGDTKTIRGLALWAREHGCALVFLRDRDRSTRREREIRDAITGIKGVRVAGGVPIEKLEHWLLALKGEKNAHANADPVASLEARHGLPAKSVTAMVQLVRTSRLGDTPNDAQSLRQWLRRVADTLFVKVPNQWP